MIEYVMLFIFMLIQVTFMIILRKNDKTLIGKGDSGALGKKGEDGEPGKQMLILLLVI